MSACRREGPAVLAPAPCAGAGAGLAFVYCLLQSSHRKTLLISVTSFLISASRSTLACFFASSSSVCSTSVSSSRRDSVALVAIST